VIAFKSTNENKIAVIDRIEEGYFDDGKWKALHRLIGDQNRQGIHFGIPVNEYAIRKIKLYLY
jgi:hypothetical protein